MTTLTILIAIAAAYRITSRLLNVLERRQAEKLTEAYMLGLNRGLTAGPPPDTVIHEVSLN